MMTLATFIKFVFLITAANVQFVLSGKDEAFNDSSEDYLEARNGNAFDLFPQLEIAELIPDTWMERTNVDDSTIMFYSLPDASNPDRYSNVRIDDKTSLSNAGFVSGVPITIVTHGFNENAFLANFTCQWLKDAYLSIGLKNLVLMDWGSLATPIKGPGLLPLTGYPIAVNNVPTAGAKMAKFVQFLINNNVVPNPTQVHLVGMSLGAHVVGIAGRLTNEKYKIKIGRITGLDPAGPLYQLISNRNKIDASDGAFVDILHTDVDALGTREPLGHVDFYSNGGRGSNQPGCPLEAEIPPITEIVDSTCAHPRAFFLFGDSIRGRKLYGCRCRESVIPFFQCNMPTQCREEVLFGQFVSRRSRGNYYLPNNGGDYPVLPPLGS